MTYNLTLSQKLIILIEWAISFALGYLAALAVKEGILWLIS